MTKGRIKKDIRSAKTKKGNEGGGGDWRQDMRTLQKNVWNI